MDRAPIIAGNAAGAMIVAWGADNYRPGGGKPLKGSKVLLSVKR